MLAREGSGDFARTMPPRAMITGITRTFAQSYREVRRVIDPKPERTPFGIHVLVGQSHTIFIADTTVNEHPSAEELADIAEGAATVARRMGHEPRVAFLSYSNKSGSNRPAVQKIAAAAALAKQRAADAGLEMEIDGEMQADTAIVPDLASPPKLLLGAALVEFEQHQPPVLPRRDDVVIAHEA